MTGKNQNLSFQLPAGQQPTADSHVYTFGNGISSESDVLEDEVEMYELRPRGKEKVRRSTSRERLDDIVFITKDIQEGDTLNAIALHYCCSVSLCETLFSEFHLEGSSIVESFQMLVC